MSSGHFTVHQKDKLDQVAKAMVAKALMEKALMAKVMVAKAMMTKVLVAKVAVAAVAAVALATAVLGINSHFLQGVGCKLHDLATWQQGRHSSNPRDSSWLKMCQVHAAYDDILQTSKRVMCVSRNCESCSGKQCLGDFCTLSLK